MPAPGTVWSAVLKLKQNFLGSQNPEFFRVTIQPHSTSFRLSFFNVRQFFHLLRIKSRIPTFACGFGSSSQCNQNLAASRSLFSCCASQHPVNSRKSLLCGSAGRPCACRGGVELCEFCKAAIQTACEVVIHGVGEDCCWILTE